MKKIIVWIFIALWALCLLCTDDVHAEEIESVDMYVTASVLNGRAKPSKKASIEARFDHNDIVTTLDWSKDHHWIEVDGGETGTVWVWWEYLTERTDEFTVSNGRSYKVKIRKEPYGRLVGYLKPGKTLVIDRVIFGWGHCSKGWIELNYLTEE